MGAIMSKQAIELLIKSYPLWHQVDLKHVPVTVRTVYTVLGRRMNRWTTILATSDDLYAARHAMNAANSSGLFDRIVIAEGRSVNKAPADKWETIECAVPYSVFVTGSSFEALLNSMKGKAANTQNFTLPALVEKQAFPFLLGLACLLAALNMNAASLAMISGVAFLDVAFLTDTGTINDRSIPFINTMRHWAYALLNGVLLLPLLLKILG
jgi:hypothetical protein